MLTETFELACRLVPFELRQGLIEYKFAEEIRLRCGCKPSLILSGIETEFSDIEVNEKHIAHVLDVATGVSFHSSCEFVAMGFLSYHSLRIGLCGQAVYKNGNLSGFKKFSSLSIRIPHYNTGLIPPYILKELIYPSNILIAAGPGVGKTSALRELVKAFSEKGFRVSLLDERGEFASGVEDKSLGKCTDVISFVPKASAAMLMLRSMNPQIIAMDEISKPEDVDAVFELFGCGVNIFATVHAVSLDDMKKRPLYKKLLSEYLFDFILTICIENGIRKYALERIRP